MSCMIAGTVRNEEGNPIGDARVWLTSSEVALPDVAAMTASDGHFALTAPVPATYEVQAAADGYQSTHHLIEVGRQTTLLIELVLQESHRP